jgi:hypothetical protein
MNLRFLYRSPDKNIAINFTEDSHERMSQLLSRMNSFKGAEFQGHPIALVGVHRVTWLHDKQSKQREIHTHAMPGCWAVHVPTLFKGNIRFDKFGPLFSIEDYHVRLSLAQKGYASIALTDFATRSISDTAGGCSLYRTAQTQSEYTQLLYNEYPGIVQIGKGKGEWNAVNPKVNWVKSVNTSLFPELAKTAE